MLSRIGIAHHKPALRAALHNSRRRCATEAAGAKTAATASSKTSSTAAPRGPQRKDWRTHKDIVYVKGVPAKGALLKLPWKEQLIIYLVFSLAGSAAVYLVRPQIRYLCDHGFLGLTPDAGWVNGPWLYRFLYIMIMFPCYSLILFIVGGVFGRRIWFSFMIHKMWSRFLTKRASERLLRILDLQHY